MIQINLLGAEKAQIYGLNLVEFNNEGFVSSMRELAKNILAQVDTISMDDLRIIADKYGIVPNHPNAFGAVFRSGEFKIVDYKKSEVVSNHGRRIAVWALSDKIK